MKLLQIILFLLILSNISKAQSFDVYPFGVRGGSDESNLSAYAVSVSGTSSMICLDAGTVYAGVKKCIENKTLTGSTQDIIKNNIKGYLISHPHLDHVAGLVMNAPDDSQKNIYGMRSCVDVLKDKYFTWKNWANFTDDGEAPRIGKYHYVVLDSGRETELVNTTMKVKAFPLSHVNPYQSTAFLVGNNDSYLLYLGDTGADKIEKSTRLKELWTVVGPLVKTGKLKAVFIEVSFPNEQPDTKLFGHLTPALLMNELASLSSLSGSLKNVSIVITHRKPIGNNEEIIRNQLGDLNKQSYKLVYPEQGKKLSF